MTIVLLICISSFIVPFVNCQAEAISESINLPPSVDLSQEKYFPPIGEQIAPSCAAWATAYYQFTYQVAKMNDWNVKEDSSGEYIFTPRYLWTYLNDSISSGTTLEDCIKILAKKGCLRWSDFPETNSSLSWYRNESEQETFDVLYKALENRVSGYDKHSLFFSEITKPVIKTVNSSEIMQIKSLLNSGHCLTFGTRCINSDFGVLPSRNGNLAGEKVVYYPEQKYGYNGHALTIVGYNDDIWYDLNGDGIGQDFEKGALKIADTNKLGNNDGFFWLMYDALNAVSNTSVLNGSNREQYTYEYFSIEVQHYSPKLTVELTVEQNKKNDISISLGRSDTLTEGRKTENTFLQALGGPISFYSTENHRSVYTEVFDYSITFANHELLLPDTIDDLFDGYDKYYWINVNDVTPNNGADTTVKKIIWRNENKEIIKELTPDDTVDGGTITYENKTGTTKTIGMNKTNSFLITGNSDQVSASISPQPLEASSFKWESGDEKIVTVNQDGIITAVAKGQSYVTARSTDGSNLETRCVCTVVDIPVSNITLSKTNALLHEGKTLPLSATVSPDLADNTNVYWSSDDTGIAKVYANGQVTAVNKGSTIIRATATDGSGIEATCVVNVIDDHADTPEFASAAHLHTAQSGEIETVGDLDCFSFIPDETGIYIFYTTGTTDTVGYLYDSDNVRLAYNNNGGISGSNFAFKYNLEKNKTYYTKVGSYGQAVGEYALNIAKGIYSTSISQLNRDARHIQMRAEAASILTNCRIWIDDSYYYLTKPTSGILETTVKGVRFKVSFSTANDGYSTIWNIHADVPSSQTEQTVYFEFMKGSIGSVSGEDINGFLPYKSSIKTGINPDSNLSTLMNSMQKSGYTLTARNWDNSLITVNSSVKAATGMKIVKTNSATGKVVEVYYLVLFGDVMGNGKVGDGIINTSDSLQVLQEALNKSKLPTEIARLAADVNHDGLITKEDSDTILSYTVSGSGIDQNYHIYDIPDECVYNTDINF